MTKPLSNDLRERLVSAVEGGLSRRSAADRFGVAPSTAIHWVARWRRTGTVAPSHKVVIGARTGPKHMARRSLG